MKPLKLSKKLNPLGEIMSLQEAFTKLKGTKHDASFENLGDWLNNNTSKPKKMKPFYKIAASFIAASLILIACSIPVQHEEEIGYMIIGIAETGGVDITAKLKGSDKIDLNQVIVNDIIVEKLDSSIELDLSIEEEEITEKEALQNYKTKMWDENGGESSHLKEIVLVLPTADWSAAKDKKSELASLFKFQNLEILPIEEEVERPFYEVALHTMDIKVGKDVSDEVVEERINTFLHENSQTKGNAKILKDEYGNRFVEIVTALTGDNTEMKMKIEGLYHGLTGEQNHFEHMTEEEILELKEQEIEEIKKAKTKKESDKK